MKIVRSFFVAFSLLSIAAGAHAQDAGEVVVTKSQFAEKVEASKPIGSADASMRTVTYWVELKNTKAPTHVVLVWKLDGKETLRQTLDVGLSPGWKTWGSSATRGAKTVEVDVLDETGATLKVDSLGG